MKNLIPDHIQRLTQAELIDSHIHLDADAYTQDWSESLDAAIAAGVVEVVVPATNLRSSRKIQQMAQLTPRLHPTCGIHPHDAASYDEGAESELLALGASCRAIGETGLEKFYDFCPLPTQLTSLRAHLSVAQQLNLPLILHCREAESELYSELMLAGPFPAGGVVHCFTGSWSWAEKFLELGFHLGVNGLVTIAKADNVHEVARRCPPHRLLLETDGPYLTPQPHRGRRNEAGLIPLIAQAVAHLRQVEIEAVAGFTTANTRQLFRLPTIA